MTCFWRKITTMKKDVLSTLNTFEAGGRTAEFYSLPRLEAQGIAGISRLPVSIRILLESVLRNCDGERITEENVQRLASWQSVAERTEEVPFVVSRVLLQD